MLPSNVCFVNCDKKIGHCAYLRGIIGWSYPIYACAVVANFPLINQLAVYIRMPLLTTPYCMHSVASTHYFTISTF